jgi:hypothetical protein
MKLHRTGKSEFRQRVGDRDIDYRLVAQRVAARISWHRHGHRLERRTAEVRGIDGKRIGTRLPGLGHAGGDPRVRALLGRRAGRQRCQSHDNGREDCGAKLESSDHAQKMIGSAPLRNRRGVSNCPAFDRGRGNRRPATVVFDSGAAIRAAARRVMITCVGLR